MSNDDFRERTRAFWESRYRRGLSTQDVDEIVRNSVGFFRVLADWAAGDSWREERASQRHLRGIESQVGTEAQEPFGSAETDRD